LKSLIFKNLIKKEARPGIGMLQMPVAFEKFSLEMTVIIIVQNWFH